MRCFTRVRCGVLLGSSKDTEDPPRRSQNPGSKEYRKEYGSPPTSKHVERREVSTKPTVGTERAS